MNLRDPKIQKILIGIVALIGVSYVYFGTSLLPFCYQVRKAEIADLEDQYTRLSAELEKARKMVGDLARLEAEYERLHLQWESAQELLPEEQEMPDLLRKVTTAGNRAGIEFMLFQPSPPVAKELFKEHPVRVRVRGGYHHLGIFLSRLANMTRIVNVSELKIKSFSGEKGKKEKNEKRNGTVVADFTLTAYTLLEGAEYEAAAQDG
ncbi:MAG: type 4a pilus biogenesis protein PilO [Candidatus Latescibacterota bacterium]|nr:MAG: type 4a pilus biogenesis protein PilO [Candidatus Latescibacterota bacterium]